MHKSIFSLVRGRVEFYGEDREIRPDISNMNELIRSGEIEKIVFDMIPDFR